MAQPRGKARLACLRGSALSLACALSAFPTAAAERLDFLCDAGVRAALLFTEGEALVVLEGAEAFGRDPATLVLTGVTTDPARIYEGITWVKLADRARLVSVKHGSTQTLAENCILQ